MNNLALATDTPVQLMFATDKIVIAPDWAAFLRDCRLDTVDAIYALTSGEIIKRANSTEVRRFTVAGHTLYLKKYWVTTPNQLASGVIRGALFGRSKVRRELENMLRLRQWGLDAPAPVAYGEHRWAGWLVRSFLISEEISEPMSLDLFVRDYLPSLPSDQQQKVRRKLLECLADYTRRLHEHRFVHHDLFWRNIILSHCQLSHFSLIDAHKGRCWHWWNEQRSRATDLATLDAPASHFFRRTDRMRFLLQYIGHRRLTTSDKRLIRLTLRLAEPLRRRQLHRVQTARAV